MSNRAFSTLCWNVCGLGQSEKCDEVSRVLRKNNPSIVCFQETKLQEISDFKSATFLPAPLRPFVHLPSAGASGGILTA